MAETFENAVKTCPPLAEHYCPGMNALSQAYKQKIVVKSNTTVTGSINMDAALGATHPNDSRWDYGIGYRSRTGALERNDSVCWVEIHPASSPHNAVEVLTKLAFHRQWLTNNAPKLASLKREFVWVATGKVAIPPHHRHRRLMATEGLKLQGQVHQLGKEN